MQLPLIGSVKYGVEESRAVESSGLNEHMEGRTLRAVISYAKGYDTLKILWDVIITEKSSIANGFAR